MNQTQKRLSIIKLAISITDIETIQLQLLKLSPIRTDTKIQEILALLQAGNYAQAQRLITKYIESAPEEILQRTSQDEKQNISEEDQAIIDEFNLFVTPTTKDDRVVEIDINDYASMTPKITKNKHTIDFDALLNIDAEDVLPDNISIDLSHTPSREPIKNYETNVTEKEITPDITFPEQDSFFEIAQEEMTKPIIEEKPIPQDTFFDDSIPNSMQEVQEKLDSVMGENVLTEKEILEEKEIFNTPISKKKEPILSYKAMPHISQKLISMKKQYPPIQNTYEKFDTVELLLKKIADEGYSEAEIEEMMTYIRKLVGQAKYTEASQLLLVCGATESKFAQFMLARELYTGSVLTKNIDEAFSLMNTLAIYDYPEALCDLGQFYENGIGTTPDSIKAEGLYKEALDLGIKRAKKHYTRLKKLNRGFFKG